MFTLAGIALFFKNNSKAILYLVIVLVVAAMLWKGYSIVTENAQSAVIIQTQQEALKNKDEQIKMLKDQIAIQQKFIGLRDQQINELNERLDGITMDLGPDVTDEAAPSIKEYFRRLGSR